MGAGLSVSVGDKGPFIMRTLDAKSQKFSLKSGITLVYHLDSFFDAVLNPPTQLRRETGSRRIHLQRDGENVHYG